MYFTRPRRERILELAMLEEHGLTLPQETTPLRGLDRGEQLNWRVRELEKVRRRRARLATAACAAYSVNRVMRPAFRMARSQSLRSAVNETSMAM